MKAQTTRGVLYMEFRHVTPAIKGSKRSRTRVMTNVGDAGTYCTIKEDDRNGDVICQAQSTLHEKDMFSFNKELGRKVALTRALDKLFPGTSQKDDRVAMWDGYHNRELVQPPWNDPLNQPVL